MSEFTSLNWLPSVITIASGIAVSWITIILANRIKKSNSQKAIIGLFAEQARLEVIHSIKDIEIIKNLSAKLESRKPTISHATPVTPVFSDYARSNIDSLPVDKYIAVSLTFMKSNQLHKKMEFLNSQIDRIFSLYVELEGHEGVIKPNIDGVKCPDSVAKETLPKMLSLSKQFEAGCDYLKQLYELQIDGFLEQNALYFQALGVLKVKPFDYGHGHPRPHQEMFDFWRSLYTKESSLPDDLSAYSPRHRVHFDG